MVDKPEMHKISMMYTAPYLHSQLAVGLLDVCLAATHRQAKGLVVLQRRSSCSTATHEAWCGCALSRVPK